MEAEGRGGARFSWEIELADPGGEGGPIFLTWQVIAIPRGGCKEEPPTAKQRQPSSASREIKPARGQRKFKLI